MHPSTILVALSLFAALPAQQILHTGYGSIPGGETGYLVRDAGDANGDGVPDVLVATPGVNQSFQLISGADFSVLATFSSVVVNQLSLEDVAPIGDINGDGHPDYLCMENGGPTMFSGSNGARLWHVTPATFFNQFFCGIGDVDGDGIPDIATTITINGNEYLWRLRGSNGTQIDTSAAMSGSTIAMVSIPDVTGDGRPDVIRLNSTNAELYSMTSPPVLIRTFHPTGSYNLRHAEVADLDGNGQLELVLGDANSSLFVCSIATGAVLRVLPPPQVFPGRGFGSRFTIVGDLDGDGIADVARLADSSSTTYTATFLVSGRDGHAFASLDGAATFTPWLIAGFADIDGDGCRDVLLGSQSADPTANPSSPVGGWQIVSTRLLATMRYMPVSCSGGPFFPQLGVTRPVLGSTMSIVGRDAPGAPFAAVLMSVAVPFPLSLGVQGCDAWFDPATGFVLAIPPTIANWSTPLALPADPHLAGLQLCLQAFYGPTNSPIGVDLSNGVFAMLGR